MNAVASAPKVSYRRAVPDDLFAVPRLARVYDELDGARDDLDHYHAIMDELGARSMLDIGCGTGTFACQLALRGIDVAGLDPAAASLDVARGKPAAERVRWIHGEATAIPEMCVDVVTMTGNVAQVFLDDAEWSLVLASVRKALDPNGFLVFEARELSARAWEGWTKEATFSVYDTLAEGRVEHWTKIVEVALPLVSFRHYYVFERDGASQTSHSTLRFRLRCEIERSLAANGFEVVAVGEAPDRLGQENVFIARSIPQRERSPLAFEKVG